ncbi:MAG: DNA/RNA helicase domain-containing protein [Actinomycetes bacterium]
MALYRAAVSQFHQLAMNGVLAERLAEQFKFRFGYAAAPAEQKSWQASLTSLAADLSDAGLDGVEVLVEHKLPLSSLRVDVILCGFDPRDGQPAFVVIELKQWSRASRLDGTVDVVLVEGARGERLHPGEQVRRYCVYMRDFIAALKENVHLHGAAYLHNATDRDVAELLELPETDQSRLFTGQRRGEFVSYLRGLLGREDGAEAADLLLGSAIEPSRQLLSLAAQEVQQRESFVLLDQQRTAYSLVMRAVEAAGRADAKEVIVVTGGPGSGKSVIALSLMGELSRRGRTVLHATGSSAFTSTLRRVAGRRAPQIKSMFKYFNQFVDAEKNQLDVLICDEAHRIREVSANRYTPAKLRTGRPQVDELLDAARVPVFLLDENQTVRPGEMGSLSEIEAAAHAKGLDVRHVSLDEQFRCGGSRLYENWVLRLLGLSSGGPVPWKGDESFDLGVADSPTEMEYTLARLNERGYTARLSAGYCWPWGDPTADGRLPEDVVIDGWRRPWNNKKESSHGGAPARSFWASDPAGFGQVGCVYTAQGFEYDYAGVIFGPDLVWRSGRWVAQPRASHDSAVKRAAPEEFERAIRNTYKVLLTRGLRGALLYSVDEETQAMLNGLALRRPDINFGAATFSVEVGDPTSRPLDELESTPSP